MSQPQSPNAQAAPKKTDSYESLLRGMSAGGYIGAGVIREYQEEFGLVVQGAAGSSGHHGSSLLTTPLDGTGAAAVVGHGMTRSRTVGDVKSLVPAPRAPLAAVAVERTPVLAGLRAPPSSALHHSDSLKALSPAALGGSRAEAEGEGDDLGIPLESSSSSAAGASPSTATSTSATISPGTAKIAHLSSAPASSFPRPPSLNGTTATATAAGSAGTSGGPAFGPHPPPGLSELASAVGQPVTVRVDSQALSSFAPSPSAAFPPLTVATITNRQSTLKREGKLVLAMVGLPARGKTAIAQLLRRHLTWLGHRVGCFNVGATRRRVLGAKQPAAFFDPDNKEGMEAREEMARLACEEMVAALTADLHPSTPSNATTATTTTPSGSKAGSQSGNQLSGSGAGGAGSASKAPEALDIAIFDATNTTVARRQWLRKTLDDHAARLNTRFQLVFVESVCQDEAIVRANVEATKLKSPDYQGVPPEEAVADFLRRIQHYAAAYQPLGSSKEEEDTTPFLKLVDCGRQLLANRISGYSLGQISFFLSNLHITPRPIYLSRHGESEFNVAGRIGGDSLLSPRGYSYAVKLGAFFRGLYPLSTAEAGGSGSPPASATNDDLLIWTSNLRRTVATAAHVGREIVRWTELNEIDAGIFDGFTYEQIAATAPEEYAARGKNKYRYRYPRGESYADIAERTMHPLIELMRTKKPVLIISHQATLRVLYSYLTDKPPETCPEALIPLHTVIKLTPTPLGMEETRFELM